MISERKLYRMCNRLPVAVGVDRAINCCRVGGLGVASPVTKETIQFSAG